MAKKQFIRHLEFYGFPDQNGYSSDINGVDLSDIIEKNKEQDKEIADLEGEKASKKDLLELSGSVETLISAQTKFNNAIVDTISGITSDIDALKQVDTEFAEQLSAVTNGLDDAMEAIETLGDRVDTIEDEISGINESIESIEENYAKKDDVYTKEEIDARIPSGETFATQEWVKEQGYLTAESGDSMYAKIEDIEDISDIVSSGFTQLADEINAVNDKVDALSGETEAKFDEVNERIDGVDEAIISLSGDIETINEEIDDLDDRINNNAEAIADLEEIVSGNTEAIEELENAVSDNTNSIEELNEKVSANTADIEDIKEELDTKADVSDLQDLHSEMTQGFDNLEAKKADKTDLATVSGTVDTIREDLDAEIARSTNVDATMQAKIDQLEEDVEETVETVETFDERIANLEDGLAQEIIDREQADLDLIGNEDDSRDADTIWGAKNFAKEMRRQAISSAETYTDNAVAGFSTELANLEDEMNQRFSSAATTGYVETRLNDVKSELRGEFTQGIEVEKNRAQGIEDSLQRQIFDISDDISSAITQIAKNSTKLHAITEWDGTDPAQYVDTGNGVLDVLHREFHEYEKTHGTIKSIEYIDGNLVITYETPEGEKQEVIPISEIIVLDDYYTKEEADALLDEKLDRSEYEDISEQVSANTENIGTLSGAIDTLGESVETLSGVVESLDDDLSGKTDLSLFNALVERLGYTDNETLQRNNEHEVAFGSYNVSNTDSMASGQTIFSVGIGTGDEDRKNALEVRNDGSVYMWVEGDYMNVNKLLGQIAHEVYDADTTHNSHFFDGD